MSFPLECKKIVKLPENQSIKSIVIDIINSQEYLDAPNFRNQCLILKENSKNYADGKFQLTNNQIGEMFGLTGNAVKKHCLKAKNPNIKEAGRPFSLKDNQIQELKNWILSLPYPPSKIAVKSYIEGTFDKYLDHKSIKTALEKADMKTEIGTPMDEDRYYADQRKISYFYDDLESFCQANKVPAQFVLNLDEEGYEEFADSKKQKVVVPKSNTKEVYYPVKKKNDHVTFLACITAAGKYLKPLLIIKRKTIDAKLFRRPIHDEVILGYQENGYINSHLFDLWLETVFVPYIKEQRAKKNYSGPAILLLDGCSSHYTNCFFKCCNENNINIFFLPPHSSNQTQPLDLGVFHLHKQRIRKINLDDKDDSIIAKKIENLYSSFQSAANMTNICSAFEAAGAVYEASTTLDPYIHFSKSFATKLLNEPKSREEKKIIKHRREGAEVDEHEHRINLSDLYKDDEETRKKILSTLQKVPEIIDYSNILNPNVHQRMIMAIVPIDYSQNEEIEAESHRGRPKKEDPAAIPQVDQQYNELSFIEKLEMELKYVGIL